MGKLYKENRDTSKIVCPHCKSEMATKKVVNGVSVLFCMKCRTQFKTTPI